MFPVIKMHLGAVEGLQSPLPPAAAGPRVNPQQPPAKQRDRLRRWSGDAGAGTRGAGAGMGRGHAAAGERQDQGLARGWTSTFHFCFRVFFGDTECPFPRLHMKKDTCGLCAYIHNLRMNVI